MSALLKCVILITGFVFLSGSFTTFVSGKRGCSSFGHSCYGGHGKRSAGVDDNSARVGATRLDKYFTKHNSKIVAPHLIRSYETSDVSPNGDMKTLLKKLVKSISEYQRSRDRTSYLEG